MSIEQNKKIAAELIKAVSAGNEEGIRTYMAPEASWWVMGFPRDRTMTRDQFIRASCGIVRKALPDGLNLKVLGMTAEGDRVAVEAEGHSYTVDAGTACAAYHDDHVRGVASKRVQVDEVWSFVHAKAKNVPEEKRGTFGYGDVWTWTAIDADSKLMVAWHVGRRDADAALTFMRDVAGRVTNRIQLTSDGHHAYLSAVDYAFAHDIDYAMLVKKYGNAPEAETRYSPAVCLGAERVPVRGRPDPDHISTSYIERSNLTIRMSNRRFTRLTNAFSKKLANHEHMLAIFFVYYNFARIHQTLRVTPAMEAGISDHVWTLEDMAALVP